MITLYGKPNCPYCVQAKNYLVQHGIAFENVDVTADPNALAFIKERGHKTVPQLYLGDRMIVEGGYHGLRNLGIDKLRERLAETV